MKAQFLFAVLLSFCGAISVTAQTSAAPCTPSTQTGVHVVQRGETLYGIARAYKISVNDLCNWNNITPDAVLPQCISLWVRRPATTQPAAPASYSTNNTVPKTQPATELPAAYPESVPPAGKTQKPVRAYTKQSGTRHVVQAGETVEGIARLYGYTTERFRSFNQMSPSDVLSVGMQLKSTDCVCPNGASAATEPSAERPAQYNNNSLSAPAPQPSKLQTTDQNQQTTVLTAASQAEMPYNVERMQQQTDVWNQNQVAEPEEREKASAAQNTVPASAIDGGKNPASYLTKEELKMIDEINAVRSNPAGYIPHIETYIARLRQSGDWAPAIATAYELIDELKLTPSLPTLQPVQCLYQAAKKHAEDQVRRGYVGHDGSDGSWPWDRVLRECPQMRDGNENLISKVTDPREAVIYLLVDDGIEARGHRRALLNGEWRYIGCHQTGASGNLPHSWIQVFGY